MAAAWLIAAAVLPAAAAEDDWKEAGTKKGVTLEFRDDDALDAREVRATTELPYPAGLIFSVVCNYSHYEELVPGVEQADVLAGSVPADYEIYLRYAPRFMVVSARDVALRIQERSEAEKRLGCGWSELPDRVPERRGTVRMPLLRGTWTIEPLDAVRSRVVYQLVVRPGGRIPGWLVRRGAVSVMPDIVDKVRACLEFEFAKTEAGPVTCRK